MGTFRLRSALNDLHGPWLGTISWEETKQMVTSMFGAHSVSTDYVDGVFKVGYRTEWLIARSRGACIRNYLCERPCSVP